MVNSSKKGGLIIFILIIISIGLAVVFDRIKINSSRVETVSGDSRELEKINLVSSEIDLEQMLNNYEIYSGLEKNISKDSKGIKSYIENMEVNILKEGRPFKLSLNIDNNTINAVDNAGNRYSFLNRLSYARDSYIDDSKKSNWIYLEYNIDGAKKVKINKNDLIGYSKNSVLKVERVEKYKGRVYLVLSYEVKNTDKLTVQNSKHIYRYVFAETSGDMIKIINNIDIPYDSVEENYIKAIQAFDKILIFSYKNNNNKVNSKVNEIISMDLNTKKINVQNMSKDGDSSIISEYLYTKYNEHLGKIYMITRESYRGPLHVKVYKMQEGKILNISDKIIDIDYDLDNLKTPIKNKKVGRIHNSYDLDIMMKDEKFVIIKRNIFIIEQLIGKNLKDINLDKDDLIIPKKRKDIKKYTSSINESKQIYIYDIENDKVTYSGILKGKIDNDSRSFYIYKKIK